MVLLHIVSVCKHVCAAIAKVPGGGGLCTFHFGVLARCSSGAASLLGTPLECLARTPLKRRNKLCTTPPKTLAMAA